MKSKVLFIITILILFIVAKETFVSKIISISDRDTFTLLFRKEQIKMRLNGVDCPVKSQAFGQKA